MKTMRLADMIGGWFVGDFEKSILRTKDVEVAVKKYAAGDHEKLHYHYIAPEITVIVGGTVRMNGVEHGDGTIIHLEPGEGSDFTAVTEVMTIVVKIPSVPGDKYFEAPKP